MEEYFGAGVVSTQPESPLEDIENESKDLNDMLRLISLRQKAKFSKDGIRYVVKEGGYRNAYRRCSFLE